MGRGAASASTCLHPHPQQGRFPSHPHTHRPGNPMCKWTHGSPTHRQAHTCTHTAKCTHSLAMETCTQGHTWTGTLTLAPTKAQDTPCARVPALGARKDAHPSEAKGRSGPTSSPMGRQTAITVHKPLPSGTLSSAGLSPMPESRVPQASKVDRKAVRYRGILQVVVSNSSRPSLEGGSGVKWAGGQAMRGQQPSSGSGEHSGQYGPKVALLAAMAKVSTGWGASSLGNQL